MSINIVCKDFSKHSTQIMEGYDEQSLRKNSVNKFEITYGRQEGKHLQNRLPELQIVNKNYKELLKPSYLNKINKEIKCR